MSIGKVDINLIIGWYYKCTCGNIIRLINYFWIQSQ